MTTHRTHFTSLQHNKTLDWWPIGYSTQTETWREYGFEPRPKHSLYRDLVQVLCTQMLCATDVRLKQWHF